MGIGCMEKDDPYYIGAIGCLGEGSSNSLSKDTDMALAIGTKLGDFTTGSWTNFQNPKFQLVSINTARFDVTKHRAIPIISDAKIGLKELSDVLGDWKAPNSWYERAVKEREKWDAYVEKNSGPPIKKFHPMLMLLELFTGMQINLISLLLLQEVWLVKLFKFGNQNNSIPLKQRMGF